MNSRLNINEKIGDYLILNLVGTGGMGAVYKAVHEKLGRAAAVKVLNNFGENFKMRFFNEARLQAGLHHPNIATLYDFQERGEQLFIFMEFVDGESLDDAIQRRRLTVEDSLQIFAAICDAVGFIHSHGIVHRDIKAQNIKLSADGTPKLLDFGIAKNVADSGLTCVGSVIGTPKYLAPEQLEGRTVTAQTDIWALGVLLYQMLTGKAPFDADEFETLRAQILKAKFTAPGTLNPAVSPQISRLVSRCLSRENAKRYQTTAELLADVRRILAEDVRATESKSGKKLFGFMRRRDSSPTELDTITSVVATPRKISLTRTVLIAGTGIVQLLLAAVGFGIWTFSRGSADENAAGISTNDTEINKPRIPLITTEFPLPGQKRVRVDVLQGKAQVVRNGKIIGATPLDLTAAEGEKINLTLQSAGFQDKNVQFEVTTGKRVYTFSMSPK